MREESIENRGKEGDNLVQIVNRMKRESERRRMCVLSSDVLVKLLELGGE